MTDARVDWRGGFDRTMVVPFCAASVDDSRRLLQQLLEAAPVDRVSRENAVVVFHELAMNAVDHGASTDDTFQLGWRLDGDVLVLTVIDHGTGGDIAVRPLDIDDSRGRGLLMVDAFSSRWAVEREGATKVMAWVALTLQDTSAA